MPVAWNASPDSGGRDGYGLKHCQSRQLGIRVHVAKRTRSHRSGDVEWRRNPLNLSRCTVTVTVTVAADNIWQTALKLAGLHCRCRPSSWTWQETSKWCKNVSGLKLPDLFSVETKSQFKDFNLSKLYKPLVPTVLSLYMGRNGITWRVWLFLLSFFCWNQSWFNMSTLQIWVILCNLTFMKLCPFQLW